MKKLIISFIGLFLLIAGTIMTNGQNTLAKSSSTKSTKVLDQSLTPLLLKVKKTGTITDTYNYNRYKITTKYSHKKEVNVKGNFEDEYFKDHSATYCAAGSDEEINVTSYKGSPSIVTIVKYSCGFGYVDNMYVISNGQFKKVHYNKDYPIHIVKYSKKNILTTSYSEKGTLTKYKYTFRYNAKTNTLTKISQKITQPTY